MAKILKQKTAVAIKHVAQSMLATKLDILKLQAKRDELNKQIEELESSLLKKDEIIQIETEGYVFDDLFDIRKIEKEQNGKITSKTAIFWKYPETYLPETITETITEQKTDAQFDGIC